MIQKKKSSSMRKSNKIRLVCVLVPFMNLSSPGGLLTGPLSIWSICFLYLRVASTEATALSLQLKIFIRPLCCAGGLIKLYVLVFFALGAV